MSDQTNPFETTRRGKTVNVVDGLFAIAAAIDGLAKAVDDVASSNRENAATVNDIGGGMVVILDTIRAEMERARLGMS